MWHFLMGQFISFFYTLIAIIFSPLWYTGTMWKLTCKHSQLVQMHTQYHIHVVERETNKQKKENTDVDDIKIISMI